MTLCGPKKDPQNPFLLPKSTVYLYKCQFRAISPVLVMKILKLTVFWVTLIENPVRKRRQ